MLAAPSLAANGGTGIRVLTRSFHFNLASNSVQDDKQHGFGEETWPDGARYVRRPGLGLSDIIRSDALIHSN